MNTTEIIARLPRSVQDRTKAFKRRYSEVVASRDFENAREYRAEINGYCKGLEDAGLITKEERQRINSHLAL